jgi:solute carrier family 27 fatty acid transporter 1/4
MDPANRKAVLFAVLWALLYWFSSLGIGLSLLAVFALYLVTGGWRFTRVVLLTLPRDFRGLMFLLDIKPMMRRYQSNGDTIVSLFQATVRQHADKVAMIMIDERQWTFREVDEYSNAIGNYFYEQGYRKGDVVAIFMESRPEFVMLWLGLAKIGVVSALINFNLRLDTLAHCIRVSACKSLVFGSELAEAIADVRSKLPPSVVLYCKGEPSMNGLQAKHIDPIIERTSRLPPPKEHTTLFNEKLFYVYTSGTTGLPKAAIVIHSRFFYMSHTIAFFFKLTSADVIYDTLPLYHTAGGILGVGNCLIKGCTLIIRRKFSASRFWDDCLQYNCTVAQYIGEICRYLLAQPHKPVDRQHKVRLMFGNGIRPQIWTEFKERFNIASIGELYGATEGNANIMNIDNRPGAIGFNTRLLPWVYPVQLIKVNQFTGELTRGKDGLCIRCEPGQLLRRQATA